MKKINTPELDKMVEVRDESQTISSFLEWLGEQEIELSKWSDDKEECDGCGEQTEVLAYISMTKEQLLAEYFGIDLVKTEKERQAILDNIRRENEKEIS